MPWWTIHTKGKWVFLWQTLTISSFLGLKGMENAAKRPDFTDPLLWQGDKNPLGIKREAGDQEDVNGESLVDQARYLYYIKNKRTGQWYKGHDEVQSKSYEHKREKTRICRMCGKEGRLFAIKRHIEAMHISGISHPCNLCDKISLSRDRLRRHKAVYHG